MVKIDLSGGTNGSGGNKKEELEIRYPTTSTGKEGSTTGTNIFGGAVPNKVGTGYTSGNSGAGTTAGTTTGTTTGANTGAAGTGISKNETTESNRTGSFGSGSSGSNKSFNETYLGKLIQNGGNGIVNIPGIGDKLEGYYPNGSTTGAITGATGTNIQTNINDLKNKYSEMIRNQSEYAADKLRTERDEALRENWILQQLAEAALPEQLAAAGLNGGAAETTLAALRARYQGNRNDIRSGYMDNLGGIAEKHAEQQAENERAYNEQWINYLMQLAQMEKEYEYDRAIAAMNNSK